MVGDRYSFYEVLRLELEKLEQEISHAHLQVVHSLDASALNEPVPGEREPAPPSLLLMPCAQSAIDISRPRQTVSEALQTSLFDKQNEIQKEDARQGPVRLDQISIVVDEPKPMPRSALRATFKENKETIFSDPEEASDSDVEILQHGSWFGVLAAGSAKHSEAEESCTGRSTVGSTVVGDVPSRTSTRSRSKGTTPTPTIAHQCSQRSMFSTTSGAGNPPDSPGVFRPSTRHENAVHPDITLRPLWGCAEDRLKKFGKKRKRFGRVFNDGLSVVTDNHKFDAVISHSTSFRSSVRCISEEREFSMRSFLLNFYISPFWRSWVCWEMFGFILLIYDMIFLPMQVFDFPKSAYLDTIMWVTMLYWTLSLFFSFFVGFQSSFQADLITERRQIAKHYLKGWFMCDALLVLSDWISVIMEILAAAKDTVWGNARVVRISRLARLLRTLRLLRVMRISVWLHQIKSVINSEYTRICFLLTCNVFSILLLAHMAACAWFGIGKANGSASWLHPAQLVNGKWGDQYIFSLGWSLSTLLNASITEVYPQTQVEYLCALGILVCGTIAVSLVFSSTTAAVVRLQQLRAVEWDKTYKLKRFLKQNKISSSLSARVIRYVKIAKRVHISRIASDEVSKLNLLSGPLWLELQMELHSPHILLHSFFMAYNACNRSAMGELCLCSLRFIFLSRYEVLFQTFAHAERMYFQVSGVMVYRRAKGAKNTRSTAKVEQRSHFCESAIWSSWIHRGRMTALIDCQTLVLEVDMFCGVTVSHHDIYLLACEYAAKYVRELNEQMLADGYIWDLPSHMMYPQKYFGTKGDSSHSVQELYEPKSNSFLQEDKHVNVASMLSQAESLSAELMDIQSDSDSEDERMLHAACERSPSSLARATAMKKKGSLFNMGRGRSIPGQPVSPRRTAVEQRSVCVRSGNSRNDPGTSSTFSLYQFL